MDRKIHVVNSGIIERLEGMGITITNLKTGSFLKNKELFNHVFNGFAIGFSKMTEEQSLNTLPGVKEFLEQLKVPPRSSDILDGTLLSELEWLLNEGKQNYWEFYILFTKPIFGIASIMVSPLEHGPNAEICFFSEGAQKWLASYMSPLCLGDDLKHIEVYFTP